MNYTLPAIITSSVILLALVLGVIGWRRRRARQAPYDAVVPAPSALGNVRGEADGLYLATTPEGSRYDRIAVAGLGFRSRTHVTVADSGILLPLDGRELFIPAADVTEVDRASWTIDRGMEPQGLVRIAWNLGGRPVESYFRFDEENGVLDAARTLAVAR